MASYATVADLRAYLDQPAATADQRVTLSGATGGTFTLSYDGAAATVAWNATAAALASALAGLAPLVAYTQPNGDPIVTVRGRRGGPWQVRFHPPLGDDAEFLDANGAGLTGTAPTVTVAPALDALMQSCLDRATGMIDAVIPPITFQGYTAAEAREVPGFGGTLLWLPPHEPGSVSAITLGGTVVTGWTAAADGAGLVRASGWARTLPDRTWEDWLTRAPLGWPYDRDSWAFGLSGVGGAYQVTARWGYGPPPPAVTQLCLELAVNIWRAKDRGLFTEVMGAEGGGALRYIGALNRSQQAILHGIRDRHWQQAL